jgi:hypothetical protein
MHRGFAKLSVNGTYNRLSASSPIVEHRALEILEVSAKSRKSCTVTKDIAKKEDDPLMAGLAKFFDVPSDLTPTAERLHKGVARGSRALLLALWQTRGLTLLLPCHIYLSSGIHITIKALAPITQQSSIMSTSTATAPNTIGAGHTIATIELRLNGQFSTSLGPERTESTTVVYQTIEILSVDKDDVVRVRGTPHYFPNSNNDRVTLPSTKHSEKLSIKAHADVPGLGRLSKPVTDGSSIPDGYKRGDELGGDYESLRSVFVSLDP